MTTALSETRVKAAIALMDQWSSTEGIANYGKRLAQLQERKNQLENAAHKSFQAGVAVFHCGLGALFYGAGRLVSLPHWASLSVAAVGAGILFHLSRQFHPLLKEVFMVAVFIQRIVKMETQVRQLEAGYENDCTLVTEVLERAYVNKSGTIVAIFKGIALQLKGQNNPSRWDPERAKEITLALDQAYGIRDKDKMFSSGELKKSPACAEYAHHSPLADGAKKILDFGADEKLITPELLNIVKAVQKKAQILINGNETVERIPYVELYSTGRGCYSARPHCKVF